MRHLTVLLLTFLAVLPLRAQNGDKAGEAQPPPSPDWVIPPAPALRPEDQLRSFKVPVGFHVELVAADPLVHDPVAMTIAPDGRLWVVEMADYMQDLEGRGANERNGRIVILSDTDGDGRMDKRSVFLDGLELPRAVSLVDDGVLVIEPPHLWFVRDTNGDGVADSKVEIADDFGTRLNIEYLPNGLLWAMDNWIYNASLSLTASGNKTLRFRYEGNGKFTRETTVTRGQWGISQDNTGRLYYNSNSDPLRFEAIPSAYLNRNPGFAAVGANVQLVPALLKVWPGRITTGINRGYKTLDDKGRMYFVTAACSPLVYRGALFPPEFRGDAFIAEPTGNLIKRIKLTEKDGALLGANAYEGTEFLTSTDERFRPLNLYNGPDGALWIVDFYRGLIQEREFITTYLRKQVEARGLERPIGLGRIWRVVPDATPTLKLEPTLAQATPEQLVAALGDGNGWTRDTAQRLLVEKRTAAKDPAVAAALRTMAAKGRNALGRLHALWTLDGSGVLERETLLASYGDGDERVAAAAVRLSERFLASGDTEIIGRLGALARSRPDPAVRLQLALSLGEARGTGDDALRALVVAAGRQAFLADAVVSGLGGREVGFVRALAADPAAAAQSADVVRFATSAVMKSANTANIEAVLAVVGAEATPEWARAAVLAGVQHFLPKSGEGKAFPATIPAEPRAIVTLAAGASPSAPMARQLLPLLKWPGKPGNDAAAARPLDAAETARFEAGRAQFTSLCAACHQPTGQGQPGIAPSLIYSRWVLGDPRLLARIVLNGKVQANMVMPPWKAALNDEAVAAVLTFIRRSWGHEADPVTAAIVAEARQATARRDEPLTDADLEAMVKTMSK